MDNEYNLTFFEACELLNRSKRTIGRYIRFGLLHPRHIKSSQGTLEYRFSRADLERFKNQDLARIDDIAQDENIVDFLKEQIRIKDRQINRLLEM